MITEDLSIFFDTNGFASLHTINGTPNIKCIVGGKEDGVSSVDSFQGKRVSIFDISFKFGDIATPRVGDPITYDGNTYTVEGVKSDEYVVTVTVSSLLRLWEMIG